MQKWYPLGSERLPGLVVEEKFGNLAELMRAGFPVPIGALIFADGAEAVQPQAIHSIIDYIASCATFETDECRPDGNVSLTVRFGDKHFHQSIPQSISFVGSGREANQEYILQLSHFLSSVGSDTSILDDLMKLDRVQQVCSILQLGFSALRNARLPCVALLQRTLVTHLQTDDGYGVAYTRDSKTGTERDQGRFLYMCTGRQFNFDFIGSSDKIWLADLINIDESLYWQIRTLLAAIDGWYRGAMHVEFGVERGKLWLCQVTRRRRIWHPYRPLTRSLRVEWEEIYTDLGWHFQMPEVAPNTLLDLPDHIPPNALQSATTYTYQVIYDGSPLIVRLACTSVIPPSRMLGLPGILTGHNDKASTLVLRARYRGTSVGHFPKYPKAFVWASESNKVTIFGGSADVLALAGRLNDEGQMGQLLNFLGDAQSAPRDVDVL